MATSLRLCDIQAHPRMGQHCHPIRYAIVRFIGSFSYLVLIKNENLSFEAVADPGLGVEQHS
jgi:hypothetical protein